MGRYRRFRQRVEAFTQKFYLNGSLLIPGAFRRAEQYEEEHSPREPVTSAAPNIGHDTDSYSSDWAHMVDLWTRALYTSLSGRLQREDETITEGHKHDDYRTELEWREVARFTPLGDVQGTAGPALSGGIVYVDHTAVRDAMNCMFHVDDQYGSLDMWVRIAQPAPGAGGAPDGWLEVKGDLYDLNTSATAVVATLANPALESKAAGVQFTNRWLGPITVPLSGCVVTRGLRFVLVRVQTRILVAGTVGGIYDVLFAKPRR